LGAQAFLALPEGWRFVPPDQLSAYFAADGRRRAGAWDLGVALGPLPGDEVRLQFEPMGWISDSAGVGEPIALLSRLQQAAAADNLRRRALGMGELQFPSWFLPPAYELAAHRLIFGEIRVLEGEETAAWRLRLPGRLGVLKADLSGAPESFASPAADAATLAAAITWAAGQGPEARQPGDHASGKDLDALVTEGVLGHPGSGAARNGSSPLGFWIVLTLTAALGLSWAAVRLWRALEGVLERKRREFRKQGEAASYERKIGGFADDVQEIADDEDDGRAP
jgi:hypothetical protein